MRHSATSTFPSRPATLRPQPHPGGGNPLAVEHNSVPGAAHRGGDLVDTQSIGSHEDPFVATGALRRVPGATFVRLCLPTHRELHAYCTTVFDATDSKSLVEILLHRLNRVAALAKLLAATRENFDLSDADRVTVLSAFCELQLFTFCILPYFTDSGCLSVDAESKGNLLTVRSHLITALQPSKPDFGDSLHSQLSQQDANVDVPDDEAKFDAIFSDAERAVAAPRWPDEPLTVDHMMNAAQRQGMRGVAEITTRLCRRFTKLRPQVSTSCRAWLHDVNPRVWGGVLTITAYVTAIGMFALAVCSSILGASMPQNAVTISSLIASLLCFALGCGAFLRSVQVRKDVFTRDAFAFQQRVAAACDGERADPADTQRTELELMLETVAQLGPSLCVPVPTEAIAALQKLQFPVHRLDALLLPVHGTVLYPKVFRDLGGSFRSLASSVDRADGGGSTNMSEAVTPHPSIAIMLTLLSGRIVYVTESLCELFKGASAEILLDCDINDVMKLVEWPSSGTSLLCKRIDEIAPVDGWEMNPDVFYTDAMVTPILTMMRDDGTVGCDPSNLPAPWNEVIDLENLVEAPFIGTALTFYLHRRAPPRSAVANRSSMIESQTARQQVSRLSIRVAPPNRAAVVWLPMSDLSAATTALIGAGYMTTGIRFDAAAEPSHDGPDPIDVFEAQLAQLERDYRTGSSPLGAHRRTALPLAFVSHTAPALTRLVQQHPSVFFVVVYDGSAAADHEVASGAASPALVDGVRCGVATAHPLLAQVVAEAISIAQQSAPRTTASTFDGADELVPLWPQQQQAESDVVPTSRRLPPLANAASALPVAAMSASPRSIDIKADVWLKVINAVRAPNDTVVVDPGRKLLSRDVIDVLVRGHANSNARRMHITKGAFGTVSRLACPCGDGTVDVIVKLIRLYTPGDVARNVEGKSPNQLLRTLVRTRTSEFEVDPVAMLLLEHPCIVRHYHSEVTAPAKDTINLDVFQEFCEGGSVRDLITGSNQLPRKEAVEDIARSVLSALAHLHERGIAHRDVKPDNVLDKNGFFKLTDFGTAIRLTSGVGEPETKGTQGYMAPEILLGEPFTTKVDIFSFGCMMLELLDCRFEHDAGGPAAALEKFRAMEKRDHVPFVKRAGGQSDSALLSATTDGLINFLRQCLKRDPDSRASAQTLLRSNIMQKRGEMANQVEIFFGGSKSRFKSGLPTSYNFSVESKPQGHRAGGSLPGTPAAVASRPPSGKAKVGFADEAQTLHTLAEPAEPREAARAIMMDDSGSMPIILPPSLDAPGQQRPVLSSNFNVAAGVGFAMYRDESPPSSLMRPVHR